MESLPPEIADLLQRLHAAPRLIAHLTLVHAVACALTAAMDAAWPALAYDRVAVRLGAAIHDVGKIPHPEELTVLGHAHELAGEALLRAQGYPEHIARFTRTHGQWAADPAPPPEDLLVALADHWWRGKRAEPLEAAVRHWIARETGQDQWQVFATLDDIASAITAEADARLAWQQQFAP